MNQNYFADLLPALAERSKLAALSRLGFANVPLRRHLAKVFSRPFGEPGAFLADPAFEAVFGWQKGNQKMSELAGSLLSDELVAAMNEPPAELKKDYRFAKNQRPYKHQLESWKILSQQTPQSLVVASGTGSGKTECFMIPILNRLARERAEKGRLIGVRALFLYPLNALINSQRERFRAWTHRFGGDIRFCLYNGNTPERPDPSRVQREYPNEVLDRQNLRSLPPPLLVTNATMLEYMLVRTADAPILAQSQGKLEWVVLDEAHTYVGSQAAEAALLLRRVLFAFGVTPEQVRFVATSATIGDPHGEAGRKLKQFLADVAGVNPDNVHLVAGQREIPIFAVEAAAEIDSLEELAATNAGAEFAPERFAKLINNATARRIRNLFIGNAEKPTVARLSEVCAVIFGKREKFDSAQYLAALRWLDLLAKTRAGGATDETDGQAFLPIRAHIFHQTLSGLWACADANCPHKRATNLADEAWRFGRVFFEPRKHCDCQSPVYEIVKCDGCGNVHLKAAIDAAGYLTHVQPLNVLDEFELDADVSETASEDEQENQASNNSTQKQFLIVNQNLASLEQRKIERKTRRTVDSGEDLLTVWGCDDGGSGLMCPICKEKEDSRTPLFQVSRLGAPFLIGGILPTLLEFAPDGEKPADSPCRGRRLLSFNDSRQGTARMAAKLQQDAERNRIRGLIYHLALSAGEAGKSQKIVQLRESIRQFETALAQELPDSARLALEGQLTNFRGELQNLLRPAAVSFDELARRLTTQGRDFDRMLAQYRQYSQTSFGDAADGPLNLAQTFLIREFGRRPKRQNNLETMGLVAVQYPALSAINRVPAVVAQIADFDSTEWRDFLKICLDFFVRARGALEISSAWRNWLGMRYPQKQIVERDAEAVGSNQIRWLRAKRSGLRKSNIVRLLSYILKANILTAVGEDRIDTVLDAAWRDLIAFGLLTQTTDGRVLKPNQLAFAPVEQSWICPVTRRLLDVTLRGVTPFLPEEPAAETAICEKTEIPIYSEPFSGVSDDRERAKRARAWLAGNTKIDQLREQSVWSDLNDRVIELSPYFTAAEHSAQQDSDTLQRYEKQFKEGSLNLLSCSTTMEMGIDIGGIGVVAMNNVPPHPANYLQRAGRAGRRGESQSLAVTLCKSNPHDQNVFGNARWAFDSALPAPRVSLDSAVIVQRHIHSFLLSKFFSRRLTGSGVESTKLTCGLFFVETAMCAEFSAWCRAFDTSDAELAAGLRQIVRHSVLESRNFNQILECAAADMEKIAAKWLAEYSQLEAEETELQKAGKENSPALRAVAIHKIRLSKEYLLRELATRGFLPAYGFPTNLASFDNLTAGRLRAEKERKREDNRFRRRELASRDTVTALREYAPGSEVVIDGLVYVSAGVTLNWHVPVDQEEAREIQNIKLAWRCGKCGASGAAHSLSAAQICAECGAGINSDNIREFLEPAGFAVDFYKEPGNDVSTQHFVPVETPWIDAAGDWSPLPNPNLGRFRVTTRGHIFNQSRGVNGTGYALCLECGRAEPMLPGAELPHTFQNPHRKLRGRRDDSAFCAGSFDNWKIKREITLGHESWTDIFELQLRSEAGMRLTDETTALTIAVGLRDALAELLGVQSSELGCVAKPAKIETGEVCQSILIFDRFAAGYSSSAERFLPTLFGRVVERLDCAAGCDSVCPHCVLDYDQRFAADSLDRHRAIQFLNPQWLNSLCLPDELAFFGKNSVLDQNDFVTAVWLTVFKRNISKIRFYTGGAANDWDVAASPLRELAFKLAGRDIAVEVMLPPKGINELNANDRYLLASLAERPQITLRTLDFAPRAGAGWVLAETFGATSIRWAVPDQKTLIFDSDWATKIDLLIKTENSQPFSPSGEILAAKNIRPNLSELGDKELEITNELDGAIQGFGKRFWTFLADRHSATKELLDQNGNELISVSYSDRYLFSPLTLILLFEIIKGLREKLGDERSSTFSLRVTTVAKQSYISGYNKVWTDWGDSDVRDRIARLVFNQTGTSFSLRVGNRSDVAHGRILELKFSSGKSLSVRLDQGVSYWRAAKTSTPATTNFDFNTDEATQCAQILGTNIGIEGADLPTQIFLKLNS